MAVSVGSSSIVTDGLVLYLDPSVSTNYVLTEVEVLVVAGGGSGGTGSNGGGGGGSGGLIYRSSYPVAPGVGITVVIGNGGSSTIGRGVGSNGQNSIFGNITASGGGAGGGSGGSSAGLSGGSGGGGMYSNTGGSGANGQGNNGGTGNYVLNGPHDAGGGGGGAGQRGEDANEDYAGRGGNGLCFSLTGTPRYYAGGGGGASNNMSGGGLRRSGAGGLGGGGRGAVLNVNVVGQNGESNTGGGGGGGCGASGGASGAGGSGIVIVRYPGPQKATGGNTITQVAGYTVHVFTSSGTFTPTGNPVNGNGINGLQDLSGNLNTAITLGTVTYNTSNGIFVTYDGTTGALSCGPQIAPPNITVSIWFRTNSVSTGQNIFRWRFYGFGLNIGNPGIISANLWDSISSNISVISSNNYIQTGTTYNACMTFGNNVLSLYVNGVLIGSTTGSLTNSIFYIPDGSGFTIGRDGAVSGGFFNGSTSSTFIYNKALTASEVIQNFNAQRGRFGV